MSAGRRHGSVSRLTARDFKNARHRRRGLDRGRGFGSGLAIGLVLALGAFVVGERSGERTANHVPVRPEPRRSPADRTGPETAETGEGRARQYDFYEMLPQFEVVVPEKERDVERLPAAKIERPGVYVLQAGSYRQMADADRVRAQLARQGITAIVQRVAVDADVWHRVRIGPVNDLAELNRLRAQLQAADLDALVIRVGE